jgi:hypothetical protein
MSIRSYPKGGIRLNDTSAVFPPSTPAVFMSVCAPNRRWSIRLRAYWLKPVSVFAFLAVCPRRVPAMTARNAPGTTRCYSRV